MAKSNNEIETKIITKALENPKFMDELVNQPGAAKAAVEAELGQKLPEDFEIRVVQESEKATYLVLPMKPQSQEELSEDQLLSVAGGATTATCNLNTTVKVPCISNSFCMPGGTQNGW